MKRAISMLVAIVMIISMIPNVFAASETAIVLEDISEIAVVLNADNGYYAEYSWIPSEDGELSLYQYTDKEIEVTIAQGSEFATSYFEDEDGAYYGFGASLNVVAGEEVIIEVINSVEEEESFTMSGSFFGAPGKSQDNPIYLEELESIVANTGTMWYAGFFGGAEVSVTGTGDFSVILNEETIAAVDGVVAFAGEGRTVIFAIVGEGEFTVKATYPVGTQMNPEILMRPASIWVNIAEGNDQGYYYKWTAMDAGQFVLTCPTIEGVSYDVTLYNLDTWAMSSLSESEDNTVAVNVANGQEVQIHIVALPDDNMAYPAVNTTLTGELLNNIGTRENPEVIFSAEEIVLDIPEGTNQGYYYKWSSFADGELTLSAPEVEGVEYDVILTNMTTYAQAWMSDSTDRTVTMAVSSGDAVVIEIGIYPDADWNIPALATTLTGTFTYPVGSYDNPEAIFSPANIPVNIAEGAAEYYYKWYANADGELKLTCPTVEGVGYNVILTNQNTYAMAWLSDSTDGTVAVAVSAGDEVLVNVVVDPDMNWNYPALETSLTGEFIYPVGTQMNPEIIFRPAYIPVSIEAGNNQGYYYKWTANADGELKLTCPTVEGVEYDVNMTNMTTYAQAWLQDSTDGTITLAVSSGDEVIIQVAALPDANWNIPALTTTLTGGFVFPLGSMMNPEVLTELSWYYGNVSQAEGDTDGYYYTWTAPAEGTATFYFGYNEGLENYVLDIIVTNQNTYAQKSLLNDGVDNYGLELQIPVAAGDQLTIQVVAIEDAEDNYAPAANMTWCGNFAYPVGSEQNPINIDWTWDEEYANATASVTVAADNTVYFNGTAGMVLTVNGVETEMSETGVFSITNSGEAETTYTVALATPVGAYSNPEVIETLPFEDANSLAADGSYNYVWTAPQSGTVTLTVTDGANLTVDKLTYSADSEWPISEQFILAEPEIDENWNYIGWIVAEKLAIDVVAGQQLKIQVNGLTDWSNWTTPAVDYTLNVAFEPSCAIVKQPEAVSVDSGEEAVFHVEVKGDVVSYKWQYRKIYKWFATSMDGYNTDTLTVAAKGSRNGYDYRCIITFADGTVLTSEPAELTVKTYLSVTYHPNDQLVVLGDKGQFTAKASGEGLKFEWEYQRPDSEKWSDTQMEGFNKETVMIVSSTNRDGYKYRCKITDVTGNVVYTNEATMRVLSVVDHPDDAFAVPGESVQFTVAGNVSEGYKYRWEYSSNGGEKWSATSMDGYNTATLTVKATLKRNGYMYRCVLLGSKDSEIVSNPATLHVGEAAVITAQPQNAEVAVGTAAVFTVEATNVYSYKWQYSSDGGQSWYGTDMTGATTDTLQVTASARRNGYQYRCRIVGMNGETIYSDAATLTVK